MDPFTQRMLERAKIRREKLDNHFAVNAETENEKIVQQVQGIKKNIQEDNLDTIKEESGKQNIMTHENDRKLRLQKLSLFYSGKSDAVLREENEEPSFRISSSKKNKCKLGRLAELADRINQWEDDINYTKHFKSEPIKEAAKENEKPKIWNPLAEKLCSQGFTFSDSQLKLSYDFTKSEDDEKEKPIQGSEQQMHKTHNLKNALSPNEKVSSQCNTQVKSVNPVLQKVALFENGIKDENDKRKRLLKDPTELTVAERKALFERNLDASEKPNERACKVSTPFQNMKFKNTTNIEKPMCDTKNNSFSEANSSERKQFEAQNAKSQYFYGSDLKNLVPLSSESTADCPKSIGKNKREEFINAVDDIPRPPPMPAAVEVTHELNAVNVSESENVDNGNTSTGRLYPSLSNLDVSNVNSFEYSDTDLGNKSESSNICLNMSLSDLLEMNKNNPTTPPSDISFPKAKACGDFNKMNGLLENAPNDVLSESDDDEYMNDYPSPPKIVKSSSFEYKNNEFDRGKLLHTVSFYRKQQQQQKHVPSEEIGTESGPEEDEGILVEKKIQDLLNEVSKQQTIISQASQALNLCLSTIEFSGSGEQVEGERLLLLASHKRQACLNEIQRLKVENSLRPRGESAMSEKGDVTLKDISISLRRDALRAMAAAENLCYFVCLVKSDERVLASPVVPATRENVRDLTLKFPGSIKLEALLSNFRITVEVYSMELNKELLPHDVKYHIANKKDKKLLTPIKSKKFDSKLVKPRIQSPASASAVRTSNFQMCGYIVFSLREVNRNQWKLSKVPYASSLEGTLSMTIDSQLQLNDEFRGFLTMFDDISGFGAWHRRWCLLSSHVVSFWKYPDDEQKKVPIGTIDLRSVVTENVSLVPHDLCARLNTFLLETTRPKLSDDKNSLVLSIKDDVTTIRHLLSADSKQEMMEWCKKLNTILALLRSWKCNLDR